MKHSELRHQPRHVNPRIQASYSICFLYRQVFPSVKVGYTLFKKFLIICIISTKKAPTPQSML